MKTIEIFFQKAADILWGDWLLFALLGLGIFYTIVTGGIQFRCLPLIARGVFKGGRKNTENDEGKNCSSYQALCAAIASCVGSGNIVGVSTAILSGGPGALFWMWVAAIFGMATKFGEITMGVRYHGKDAEGNIAGGPMYYIAKGLNWKCVGALVAILLFIQNCGATLIQSNTIAQVANEGFHAPVIATAVVMAVIMSQWYFGHISLTFLKKPKWASVYRVIFPFLIILGSLSTIDMVWSIQDVALGLLIIPNIIALIFLAPEVRKLTKEFLDPANGYIRGDDSRHNRR